MSQAGERLFAAFERLRRLDGGALAVLDTVAGAALDRDGLALLVDRAGEAIAAAGVAIGATTAATAGCGPRIVALQLPNGAALIAAVLAGWRAGLVPLPCDAELAPAEVRECCARLGVRGVLCGPSLELQRLDEGSGAPAGDAPPAADTAAAVETALAMGTALAADTALLRLTSGTTGEPRAVAVTGAALEADVAQIASTKGITGGDRILAAIPLPHAYGFGHVILTLAMFGCPAILVGDLTPRHLLAAARRAGATVFPAVPFLLDLLARSPEAAGGAWPGLRLVISAGAPLPVETRERFAARFGVRPRNFYGASECGGISFDREGTADVPEGCVGTPLDGVTIDLHDAENGVGRVAIRSRAVASGYVPSPPDTGTPPFDGASTAVGLPPRTIAADAELGSGRFVTSDLGGFDDRGRLHLLGRASDVINVGGRKVFPAEVERVIRRIAGVRDVAVLGMARSAVADAVRAVVVADPAVDRAAVLAACATDLAPYKVPRAVDFVPELPRTVRGKLDRHRLGDSG